MPPTKIITGPRITHLSKAQKINAHKPMVQSRCGVVRMLEAQVHPLVVAIPRFIQIGVPLLPLKPMAQLRRDELPHALIEPSALRAAKTPQFE
jgi:hypothetical protein